MEYQFDTKEEAQRIIEAIHEYVDFVDVPANRGEIERMIGLILDV